MRSAPGSRLWPTAGQPPSPRFRGEGRGERRAWHLVRALWLRHAREKRHPEATDAAPEAPCSSQRQALGPRFREGDGEGKIRSHVICRGKSKGRARAFRREFWFQKPLARARPGHPRLEPATISAPKTWMAGPSPTAVRFSSMLQLHEGAADEYATFSPRGRTWSGHPRLLTLLRRRPRRRGWPGRARPWGSLVASSMLQTTSFTQPDSHATKSSHGG
jgi:hypothetical protein